MDNQNKREYLQMMKADGGFEITPCDTITDIETRTDFSKLKLTTAQQIQVGGFLQQMPALAATNSLAKAYTVKFPEGISETCKLMQYGDGGFGSAIQGEGGIVGHASFHEAGSQAAVLNAFNVMSVASGQYFLAQINGELKTMNQNLDQILEFLYGNKKAELLAEVSFTKYAYQNYNSIMDCKEQRLATIAGLQGAKKVAMKDIEFYMSDLDSAINSKNGSDIAALVDRAFQIKDCLELSMQLYVMGSLLEVYYAQNYDRNYICYVEDEASVYVGKCEKRMLSCFSVLSTYIHNFKENLLKKLDKPRLIKRVDDVVDRLSRGTESEIRKSLRSAIRAVGKKAEYYMNDNGDLYIKNPQ